MDKLNTTWSASNCGILHDLHRSKLFDRHMSCAANARAHIVMTWLLYDFPVSYLQCRSSHSPMCVSHFLVRTFRNSLYVACRLSSYMLRL